jgi:hypothetical protein
MRIAEGGMDRSPRPQPSIRLNGHCLNIG